MPSTNNENTDITTAAWCRSWIENIGCLFAFLLKDRRFAWTPRSRTPPGLRTDRRAIRVGVAVAFLDGACRLALVDLLTAAFVKRLVGIGVSANALQAAVIRAVACRFTADAWCRCRRRVAHALPAGEDETGRTTRHRRRIGHALPGRKDVAGRTRRRDSRSAAQAEDRADGRPVGRRASARAIRKNHIGAVLLRAWSAGPGIPELADGVGVGPAMRTQVHDVRDADVAADRAPIGIVLGATRVVVADVQLRRRLRTAARSGTRRQRLRIDQPERAAAEIVGAPGHRLLFVDETREDEQIAADFEVDRIDILAG